MRPLAACLRLPPLWPLSLHCGGVNTRSHATKFQMAPGFLVPGSAILFSRPPVRPECSSVHLYTSPRMAYAVSPRQDHFPAHISRRHCRLAPRQGCLSRPNAPAHALSTGHGVPAQPGQVPPVSLPVRCLAGCAIAPSVGSLASSSGRTDERLPHGPVFAPRLNCHTPSTRAAVWGDQLCVPD